MVTKDYDTKLKKLTKEIFDECAKDGEPVTMEEAEEMAKLELKSRAEVKHYEKSDATVKKERKPKERKVDETKKRLLMDVKTLLEGLNADIIEVKTETEINFDFEGANYTFKLTRHKEKKSQGGCCY
jgi:hypothetical protein